MEIGHRYLLRAEYAVYNYSVNGNQLRSSDSGGTYVFRQLTPDGLWYLPVEPGEVADFSDPRLAGFEEQLRIFDDNQHAVPAVASMDVSA